MDGTLYADRRLGARVALEAARRALAGRPVESLRALRTLSRFRREAELCRGGGGALGPAWEAGIPERLRAEAWLMIPAIRRIGLAPGVLPLLDRLRGRCRVVAVSDFAPENRLDALGVRDRFERIHAAERIGALKPDPRVFRAVHENLGIPAAALLHIGNRPETDGRAARAAGCRALILGEDFASFGDLADARLPRNAGLPERRSS